MPHLERKQPQMEGNDALTCNVSVELLELRPGRSPGRSRTMRAASEWCREALKACGLFEWTTLAYLGFLNLLILAFGQNLPGALYYFAAHLGVAGGIVILSWAAQRLPYAGLRLLRRWYPLLLFIGFFEELHHLVHLIFPGWFDGWLIEVDHALVGVHPTVWLERFASPALNDFMQMAYLTYFFYLVLLAGALYARCEWRGFWAMMTSTAIAYYIVYLMAIFFPVEGPYHSLAALQRVELTGGFFTRVLNLVERFGRVHGAAFPSAHVAGSFVALLGAWRYRRWMFWVFLPFFLCMLIATVYARYHYIADGLAGLVTGAAGFHLGHALIESKAGFRIRTRPITGPQA